MFQILSQPHPHALPKTDFKAAVVPKRFLTVTLSILLTFYGQAHAGAEPETEDTPPRIAALLAEAERTESNPSEPDAAWPAAVAYCEASRLGSLEAQYRLGMLYAFGNGVPMNRALAAAMFSLAAHQGHYEAQKMLETINLVSSELPPCVTAEVLPEKPPKPIVPVESVNGNGKRTPNIDHRLAVLPQAKRWIVDLVETLARWYDIDPRLVLAIIAVESNFEVKARSPKSAMGLMQLIPGTAERFNVKNAFDATQNIKGGIRYLRWLLAYYQGDIAMVAAAYNAGEKAVDRYRGVPPYPETQNYVKRVLELYQRQTHPYEPKVLPSPVITRPG